MKTYNRHENRFQVDKKIEDGEQSVKDDVHVRSGRPKNSNAKLAKNQ